MIRTNVRLDALLRCAIERGLGHTVKKAAKAVFIGTTAFYETVSALEKKDMLKQFAASRHGQNLYIFDMSEEVAIELLDRIVNAKYYIKQEGLVQKIAKIIMELEISKYYDFETGGYVKSTAQITNLDTLNAELERNRSVKMLAERRIARFHPTDEDVLKAYNMLRMQKIIET